MNKKLFFILLNSMMAIAQAATTAQSTTTAMNDNKLHIYFCGTGEPNPITQNIRKPACLAVVENNNFLLFDAGEGAISTLATLIPSYMRLSNIFITHWHSDHFSGLAQVLTASWYMERENTINLYGPYGIYEVLNGLKRAYRLDVLFRSINEQFDPTLAFASPHLIDPNKNGKNLFQDSNLSVSAFQVDHSPVYPALGYVLNYKNCKIVISGDTKIVPSLADQAKDADVLINEALNAKMLAQQRQRNPVRLKEIEAYHSETLALAKMAQASQVKRLYLTHFVPFLLTTAAAKKEFTAGMDQYYSGPIVATDDRDQIEIESNGKDPCKVTYLPAKPLEIKFS